MTSHALPACMVCRARAYYRTQCFGAAYKCPQCLEMQYGRGVVTGPCGHILCAACDASWAAHHFVYPTLLSDYEPLDVVAFTDAVAAEDAAAGAPNPDAEAETLPWIAPPTVNENGMSDSEDEPPAPDPAEGLFYGRAPPMPPLMRAVTVEPVARFHRLGYEMIAGSETFLHCGAAVVWCFSTRFWECVLLDIETCTLTIWSIVVPAGLADWTPHWRAVQRAENRRWVLQGGSTPLSRVGGVPHRAEHF